MKAGEKIMPYGKHKGKKINELPPDYLLYLWDNDRCTGAVFAHIHDNLEDILSKNAEMQNIPLDVFKLLRDLKSRLNTIMFDKTRDLLVKYCFNN